MNSQQYKKIEQNITNKIFYNENAIYQDLNPSKIVVELNDTVMIGKLKLRHYSHNQYPDWILEKDSLLLLIKESQFYKGKKIKFYYVNYFLNDSYLVIWDLIEAFKKYNIPVHKKIMNAATSYNLKGFGSKIEKDIYLLKNEYAVKIKKMII